MMMPTDQAGHHAVTTPVDSIAQNDEQPVDVRTAARFLGVSPSLVYSYVERMDIPGRRTVARGPR